MLESEGKMKGAYRWNNTIGNRGYRFSYEVVNRRNSLRKDSTAGYHLLRANDSSYEFPVGRMDFLGVDVPFVLDGQDARFVAYNKKADVAVDGVFLGSGKRYVKRPSWVWIFVVLSLLIPIVSMGGALPAVFGMGGACACIGLSKQPIPAAVRILACTAVTAAAWILWLVLIVVMM